MSQLSTASSESTIMYRIWERCCNHGLRWNAAQNLFCVPRVRLLSVLLYVHRNVGLLETGAQDGLFYFHAAPELSRVILSVCQDGFQVRQVETPEAELRLQSFCMHVFCPMWPFSRSDIYTYNYHHNNMLMIFYMRLNDSFMFLALYNTLYYASY